MDLGRQLTKLQLEAEMDTMEAPIDARTPKIPILKFALMPGFNPPVKSPPEPDRIASPTSNPTPPPKEKEWAYPGYGDDRRPEDDLRN